MSREMVNSGIPWIGEIPNGWKVARLKNVKADIPYAIVDGPFGSAISTNDYRDSGVPLVRIVNLSGKYVDASSTVYISDNLAETVKRSSFRIGDIIVAKTGATVGKCAINNSITYGILSSSCVKVSISDEYDTRYYYYLFQTNEFNNALREASGGSTRDTINLTPFNNLYCLIPSLREQQKIASFLDRKCSEIDEMIALQEKVVEELKAYKQSVITEAVTKGLNPDVPMKDSGIEWIGEIPEHWKMCRVKDILEAGKDGIKIGPFGSSLTNKVNGEGECKIYGQWNIVNKDFTAGKNFVSAETYRELDAYKIVAGDILVSMMGTIGKCAIIPNGLQDGIMDSHVIKIRINKNIINPEFFELMYDKDNSTFIFEQLSRMKKGSIMDGLNSSIVKRLNLLLPPINEQQEIASYLLEKRSQIDNLISIKLSKIDSLKEYKKSIIYEYVTGKKEVTE